MTPQSSTTCDEEVRQEQDAGSITVTTSTSYSRLARLFYLFFKLFSSNILKVLTSKPTKHGYQGFKVPNSLHQTYTIKKRDFHDWEVYDIAKKSKSRSKVSGPPDEIVKRRIIYIPGTGLTRPASTEHFKFCTNTLAKGLNATVTVVLHPLAPQHNASKCYPRFFELYGQLIDELPEDGELDIGGDSSGGCLALSIALHSREMGMRFPSRLFLMAPSLDFVKPQLKDIPEECLKDPLQTIEDNHDGHLKWINGDWELDDPRCSPIRGNFDLLKDVRVVCVIGTYDLLYPDTVKLRGILREHGVQGHWFVGEKMVHCFPLLAVYGMPEAKAACKWIKEVMK